MRSIFRFVFLYDEHNTTNKMRHYIPCQLLLQTFQKESKLSGSYPLQHFPFLRKIFFLPVCRCDPTLGSDATPQQPIVTRQRTFLWKRATLRTRLPLLPPQRCASGSGAGPCTPRPRRSGSPAETPFPPSAGGCCLCVSFCWDAVR